MESILLLNNKAEAVIDIMDNDIILTLLLLFAWPQIFLVIYKKNRIKKLLKIASNNPEM